MRYSDKLKKGDILFCEEGRGYGVSCPVGFWEVKSKTQQGIIIETIEKNGYTGEIWSHKNLKLTFEPFIGRCLQRAFLKEDDEYGMVSYIDRQGIPFIFTLYEDTETCDKQGKEKGGMEVVDFVPIIPIVTDVVGLRED